MHFHDTYIVKAGDNLTKIGMEFGFPNPGPIFAYPANADRFRNKSPDLIYPNESFVIPWRRDLLQEFIAACTQLINEVSQDAQRLINEQIKDKQQLDNFLMRIDALNFLGTTAVGIGSLVRQGLKGVEMSSKETLQWLARTRVEMARDIAGLLIPAPTAPKRDFKFYLRHALGPWSPSFWTSVIVAIQQQDVDIYLYGSDAIAHKTAMNIKRQADADIYKLKHRIAEAEQQLAQPFYNHRI